MLNGKIVLNRVISIHCHFELLPRYLRDCVMNVVALCEVYISELRSETVRRRYFCFVSDLHPVSHSDAASLNCQHYCEPQATHWSVNQCPQSSPYHGLNLILLQPEDPKVKHSQRGDQELVDV